MEQITHTVDDSHNGERLDKWLSSVITGFSRNRIQNLIAKGCVHGPDMPSGKLKVNVGDTWTLTIPTPEPSDLQPYDHPLDVLYHDDHLLVIKKPKGLIVHPGAGHRHDTLVNVLIHLFGHDFATIGDEERPGIVHRLDKDTSGVMVVAKTAQAHAHLADQFKEHTITRRYHAWVKGVLKETQGTIKTHLGRHQKDRKKQAVRENGRLAITHYKVLRTLHNEKGQASLVECTLETGRTHQIRVHMAHIGHSVLGDPLYGVRRNDALTFDTQALHAAELTFIHPVTHKEMSFKVEADFEK